MMSYPVARRRILVVEGGLREQCAGVCASLFREASAPRDARSNLSYISRTTLVPFSYPSRTNLVHQTSRGPPEYFPQTS